jgi:hypothetical protein
MNGMATVENVVNVEHESIATPIKVVVIGAIMAIIVGVYDIVNANLYAGVFDGVEVTAGEVVVVTGIAIAFALAMLYYAYSERHTPSKRVYVVLGVLIVLTLVEGVLFTAAIALLGAGIGYWDSSDAGVN